MLSQEQIANIIMDRCEEILEYEYGLGICNSGTAAYKAADDILAILMVQSQQSGRVSNERPEAEDPEGMSPLGRQRDGEAGTPEATPQSSPEQPPSDPQELSFGLGCYDFASSVAAKVAALPWAWAETGDAQDDRYTDVQMIVDAELRSLANDRTLQEAGEVQ